MKLESVLFVAGMLALAGCGATGNSTARITGERTLAGAAGCPYEASDAAIFHQALVKGEQDTAIGMLARNKVIQLAKGDRVDIYWADEGAFALVKVLSGMQAGEKCHIVTKFLQ